MLEFNFNPFPTLETERLILREVSFDDAKDFFVHRSDKETMKYIGKPLHKTVSETEVIINKMIDGIKANETIAWAITLKGNPKFLGTIGYHRISREHHRGEIGYMIGKEHWNKGIVSEAAKKIIDYGFTKMKFHSIEGVIDPNNIASKKLLTKSGFVKEAYFKENYLFDGKFVDTEIYSLLKKD